VLGTVARKGSIGVGELADVEGLNPTMLSRMVGKLEASGWLSRVPDARDGRVVIVQVTEAGAALQERLRAERTQLFVDRLAELPDDLAAQLVATLPAIEALADLMRRKSGSAPASRTDS
jgi:DNA-binding MarR family transcriptional regulator